MERMDLQDIKKRFEESTKKQHDYRHLPRTRCVVTYNERLEIILPPGEDASTFCQGRKVLDPKAHQVVYPQTKAGLQVVLIDFDTGMIVYVYPETLLPPG